MDRQKKFLWLWLASLSICFFGCDQRGEVRRISQLRNVYVATKNYYVHYQAFPEVSGNRWRFSTSTRFEYVSWRGVVLEGIEGLGGGKGGSDLSVAALETQIDTAARSAFLDGKKIVYSNLREIEGRSMAELPRDFVLFCLLDRPEGVSWNSDETSPLVDIGLEELRQRGELLCVLVDGSVVRFNLKSAGVFRMLATTKTQSTTNWRDVRFLYRSNER